MRLIAEDLACRRSGRRIFAGLSFTLAAGEALTVTGRNGAGKSSLLAILAGRLRPEAGRLGPKMWASAPSPNASTSSATATA